MLASAEAAESAEGGLATKQSWLVARVLAATLASLAAIASPTLADHSIKELISTGVTPEPFGGADFGGMTADGQTVFFELPEGGAVYRRSAGTSTRISVDSSGTPAATGSYGGSTPDAGHVYFDTRSPLVAQDTDNAYDVYERFGSTTTLISDGQSADRDMDSRFIAVNTDGTRVLFSSGDWLTADDQDSTCDIFFTSGCSDVYLRAGGTTSLVSSGPAEQPASMWEPQYDGASTDLTKVFFSTYETITSDDSDGGRNDLFQWSNGTTTLISTGPTAGSTTADVFGKAVVSSDGAHVFFETGERLTADDPDSRIDVYRRSNAAGTELVSRTPTDQGSGSAFIRPGFGIGSEDGTRAYFTSQEKHTADDLDSASDGYVWSNGTLARVTTGSIGGNGDFGTGVAGASADGSRAFFTTREQMVVGDVDTTPDIYERSGGQTTLVSTGPTAGAGTITGAVFGGISSDGARVFFIADEALVPSDTDSQFDVYERFAGQTTLLSTGPAGGNGAHPVCPGAGTSPQLPCPDLGISDDGKRVFFETAEKLTADDQDPFGEDQRDVYAATAAAGYPRPQAGRNFRVPLAIAYAPCPPTNANRVHGPALTAPSCNPPVRESAHLVAGTLDVNGASTQLVGFLRLTASIGDPVTPADEADVAVHVKANDVRLPNLDDYTGELQASLTIRTTDRSNGGTSFNQPGTAIDLPVSVTVPCTTVAGPATGSNCEVLTTVDAVVPQAVLEGRRSNWELARIEVLDGGADGNAETSPNTPFLRQGIFIP